MKFEKKIHSEQSRPNIVPIIDLELMSKMTYCTDSDSEEIKPSIGSIKNEKSDQK